MRFEDGTDPSGLLFRHDAGQTPEKQLPETMGAGAAIGDFNEDGHLDLYLVQSGTLPHLKALGAARTNELWLGDGKGHFRNATEASGDGAHGGYGMGVAMGDYNGDGHLDLYVTNLGLDALLAGDGKGGFVETTLTAGLQESRWTAGSTFFDADGDGDLDLYVSAYLDYDLLQPYHCGDTQPGWRSYCHPDRYEGLQDRFWRNRGDGTFEDATLQAGLSLSTGKGLGVVAADLDADGDLDLYVANDSVENRLWLNDGNGNFEDATMLSGTGVNGFGLTEAGMGIAVGDLNGDGRLDLYVTNFDDESNTHYQNDGAGFFSDVTAPSGLEASTRLPVGFGAVAADLDDDGDLDLAVANGHIIDNIHLYHDGKSWAQKALLFRNMGDGRFEDISKKSGAFGAIESVGRGLYAADLDEDGDLDLLQTANNGAARIFFQVGHSPGCISILGLPPGTRVRFHTQGSNVPVLRQVGPHGSYFGASAPEVRYAADAVHSVEAWLPGGVHLKSALKTIAPGRYQALVTGTKLELLAL
ncbi:MAG: hypothetical protein ACI9F9_002992 [Candidatus Paceibacteria bacterium]|jgi:hypothetical protein